MIKTFDLNASGRTFLFEFVFDSGSSITPSQGYYIEYKLLRTDEPKNVFLWKGYIDTQTPTPFEISFPNQIDIKGTMSLYLSMETAYIWIDAYYGMNLEQHFEGNIVAIPDSSGKDDPPIPPPAPDPIEDL